MERYRTLYWWEWCVLGIYWTIWIVAVIMVLFWCAAAVSVGSAPAAGVGGFALALLWISNPDKMVEFSPERTAFMGERRQ